MKIITMARGKVLVGEEARLARLEAAIAIQATRILDAEEEARRRLPDAPDRGSVRRAMTAVETRIVEALWVLARLPGGQRGGSCGLAYIQETTDRFANAVANGGKWEEIVPRPSLPSARAIDAMDEPMEWLTWLPREDSKLISVAAGTKRGDVERNVSWGRVRAALPQTQTQTVRTLQRRYDSGIRTIAGRLTIVSHMS